MKYRTLGKTGFKVSAVSYGGVISSKHFDKAVIPGDGQKLSDEFVDWALNHGINYFDVAPGYGDAQQLMGNSLKGKRRDIYLACKTAMRDRENAEKDMKKSMELLHTDYFDVYQLHGIATMEELDRVFAPGGAMELLRDMKEKGIARKIGITAHNEAAVVKALTLFDFDTVLFPFNWHMNMAHGMGNAVKEAVKAGHQGLLGIKAMIERSWEDEERYTSRYPKSWCKPFDIDEEPEMLTAAMRYAFSLGIDTLIPPGNFDHFRFAVEHIDEVLEHPVSEEELTLLKKRLPFVKDYPFMDEECYTPAV